MKITDIDLDEDLIKEIENFNKLKKRVFIKLGIFFLCLFVLISLFVYFG